MTFGSQIKRKITSNDKTVIDALSCQEPNFRYINTHGYCVICYTLNSKKHKMIHKTHILLPRQVQIEHHHTHEYRLLHEWQIEKHSNIHAKTLKHTRPTIQSKYINKLVWKVILYNRKKTCVTNPLCNHEGCFMKLLWCLLLQNDENCAIQHVIKHLKLIRFFVHSLHWSKKYDMLLCFPFSHIT